MIYIFRKEMKKWTNLLWIFVIVFPLGALLGWLLSPVPAGYQAIATVDGAVITANEYQQSLLRIEARIANLKAQAQQYGFDPSLFIRGELENPKQAAFNEVVSEKLLDQVESDLSIELDDAYVVEQLGKSIPEQLMVDGRINERYLEEYLRHMHMSVKDFEESLDKDLKRQVVVAFAEESAYAPRYALRATYANDNAKKSFEYVQVPLSTFVEREKGKEVSPEGLGAYFEENRESYRVPEKREAVYAVINIDAYLPQVQVSDEEIDAFYDKNKTSLYRIPPEVKVRKILFKLAPDASDAVRAETKARAMAVLEQVKQEPNNFAPLAKKHSQDQESAATGGMVDFFARGTHNDAFEAVAFRLQEVGEIGEMVETKDGIELLQLVERRAASYKPLEAVSKEIAESLTVRKAERQLKSDLEIMRNALKTNPNALVAFINSHKLKGIATPAFTKTDGKGKGRTAKVVEKVFGGSDAEGNQGYFADGTDFVLYKEVKRATSYVPKLADIRDKVVANYVQSQARAARKQFVKMHRAELLAGRATLQQVAQAINGSVKKTGLVAKSDKVADLEKVSNLLGAAFALTDQHQVLKFKHSEDRYLVQVKTIEPADMAKYPEEEEQLVTSELAARKRLNSSTFIDSLRRIAKLESSELAQMSMPA